MRGCVYECYLQRAVPVLPSRLPVVTLLEVGIGNLGSAEKQSKPVDPPTAQEDAEEDKEVVGIDPAADVLPHFRIHFFLKHHLPLSWAVFPTAEIFAIEIDFPTVPCVEGLENRMHA